MSEGDEGVEPGSGVVVATGFGSGIGFASGIERAHLWRVRRFALVVDLSESTAASVGVIRAARSHRIAHAVTQVSGWRRSTFIRWRLVPVQMGFDDLLLGQNRQTARTLRKAGAGRLNPARHSGYLRPQNCRSRYRHGAACRR